MFSIIAGHVDLRVNALRQEELVEPEHSFASIVQSERGVSRR